MRRHKKTFDELVRSTKGITLIELVVVMVLIGILSAIATPSFLQWRQNLEYRQAARDIVSMLRNARNQAISTNVQYRVEFDAPNRKYGLRTGNSAGNTDWNDLAVNPTPANWVMLPQGVAMNPSANVVAGGIVFSPNGTSTAASTVQILDVVPAARYTVNVATSGRIWVYP